MQVALCIPCFPCHFEIPLSDSLLSFPFFFCNDCAGPLILGLQSKDFGAPPLCIHPFCALGLVEVVKDFLHVYNTTGLGSGLLVCLELVRHGSFYQAGQSLNKVLHALDPF
jgi:hypothetical protein